MRATSAFTSETSSQHAIDVPLRFHHVLNALPIAVHAFVDGVLPDRGRSARAFLVLPPAIAVLP